MPIKLLKYAEGTTPIKVSQPGKIAEILASLTRLCPCRCMSSSGPSPSLADRLVTACLMGDLLSAKATVADGASVNEQGMVPRWSSTVQPLTAALSSDYDDVVVWLLSLGADQSDDRVMWFGAYKSTAATLQLLIDAGGDVNRTCHGEPPLIAAVDGNNREDVVRVLLAQPSLDFTIKCNDVTSEQYAHDYGAPAAADMITQEVSAGGSGVLVFGSR